MEIRQCYHSCPFFRTSHEDMYCGHPVWKEKGEEAYGGAFITQDNSKGRVPEECPLRQEPLIVTYHLSIDKMVNEVIDQMEGLLAQGRVDDALDALWDGIYPNMILRVPLAEAMMKSERFHGLDDQVKVSFLAITLPHKHMLQDRSRLVQEVERSFTERNGAEYAEAVMKGLR